MTTQVFVSTLQSDLGGQVSVFPLPLRFDWLRHLDSAGIAAFLTELLETVRECQETGEWRKMERLISAWKETAYLMSSPANRQMLLEALRSKEEIPFEVVRERIGFQAPGV